MRDIETLMRNEVLEFIVKKMLLVMEVEKVSLGEEVLTPLGEDYATAFKLLRDLRK